MVTENKKVHIILRKGSDLWRIKDILGFAAIHYSDLYDIRQLSRMISRIKPDVIYHLAAYGAYPHQDNPDLCIKTNIQGTWNLLRATSDIDYELFVNTGSSSEYGFKRAPMKESDFLQPASSYAVTKSSQTLLCSYFAKENKKTIVTIRPFSVYGPYEDKNRFVPTLLRSLHNHERMDLVSPDIVRDWIYVDDVVDAYLLTGKLKKFSGETFNIGAGTQRSIQEVVETAVGVTGESTRFRWRGMKNRIWDTTFWVADMSKTKKLLNWRAKIDMADGLSSTWEWFLKNHQLWK
jgi:nucleoside-diphosphate-sugar epimerase